MNYTHEYHALCSRMLIALNEIGHPEAQNLTIIFRALEDAELEALEKMALTLGGE